jgi:hypothetical protein
MEPEGGGPPLREFEPGFDRRVEDEVKESRGVGQKGGRQNPRASRLAPPMG